MAKIIGDTIATPNPRPDWLQTDENKADYIKNKPTILTEEEILNLIGENGGGGSSSPQDLEKLERLKYYGDSDTVPTDPSYFTYSDNGDGTCVITGITQDIYDEQVIDIVFPYEINGLIVTKISHQGVSSPTDIFGMLICRNIKTIIMPDTIKEIDDSVFSNTYDSLEYLRLSENLKTIGDYNFDSPTLIEELYVPDSVETIGSNTHLCSFASIVSMPHHSVCHASPGMNNNKVTLIIRGGTEFTSTAPCLSSNNSKVILPDTCKKIGPCIFYNSENPTLVIPSSVAEILQDDHTEQVSIFEGCTNPTIVCEQGSYADTWAKEHNINAKYDIVDGSKFLRICDLRHYYGTEDIVPTSESYFSYNDNGDGTCVIIGVSQEGLDAQPTEIIYPYEINGLKVVEIRNNALVSGDYNSKFTFNQATSVVIPSSVTKIGNSAFSGTKITDIYIPDSVTEIRGTPFCGCPLKTIRLSENLKVLSNALTYSMESVLETLYVPDSVKTIDDTQPGVCIMYAAKYVSIPHHALYSHGSPIDVSDAICEIRGGEVFKQNDAPCFESATNVRIIFPKTCKTIDGYIILNAKNCVIEIPSSVVGISGLMMGDNSNTIVCEQGSFAAYWAQDMGFNVKYDIVGAAGIEEIIDEKVALLTEGLSGKAERADTLAGYGITDAYTKTEVETKINEVLETVSTKMSVRIDGTKLIIE